MNGCVRKLKHSMKIKDVPDGAALVKLAKDKQKILFVGHILHYHPAVVRTANQGKSGH